MKIEQILYKNGKFNKKPLQRENIDWVLVFESRKLVEDNNIFDEIRIMYPSAYIMGCSSAGEIQRNTIADNSLNITAVNFEKSQALFGSVEIEDNCSFFDVGVMLAEKIDKNDLKHVFILTDGVNINGSKLIYGIKSILGLMFQ